MNKRSKGTINCLLACLSILLILHNNIHAQSKVINNSQNKKGLTKNLDTSINTSKKSEKLIQKKDSLKIQVDTLDIKMSKDSIDAVIDYNASDSGVLLIDEKLFLLYGKAKTSYKDLELEAATIKLDQDKQLLIAYGNRDSTNSPYDKPQFKQGGMTSISDSIFYNIKSQKGLTKGTYYQEGEIFVYAKKLKKVADQIFYAQNGRFTTCNLDTPHFAFRTSKMKLINNKIAVTGPAIPEFEGVPVPIGIPFGIFPLNQGRHSGLLPPQFTANEDFGLGLEGLGLYNVLSENLDVTVRANIYSYGGWTLNTSAKYLKRYKYSGSLNLTIQNTKILNRTGKLEQEFTKNQSFMIGWSHSRDSKARPGTNFSANVNAGSTKFNRFVSNNANLNFQNQLSSSINYSKTWDGKYNLSVSANHNQNNASQLINLNLPTVNFNVITVYPFEKKNPIGAPKWYEKIGIGYSGNIQNQISFYDSAFSVRKILDTMQWGASHNIPITLSLPQLGPLQIAPSISYEEKWYGQKTDRVWDTAQRIVKLNTQRGLYAARQMQVGLSLSTRIFGTYNFKKSKSIDAIRHEIRPSIGFSYKPDLVKKYFKNVQIDTTGKNFFRYSQFDGGIMGSYGEGTFGGLSFGVDNILEMKVKDKSDTSGKATKKVKLIDGYGFGGSYNFVADSFKLSPFSFYLRSTLFEKINITASTTLDPYEIDNRGYRKNKLLWIGDKFNLGRITNGSIAISTQLQSKSKDGKTDKDRVKSDQFMTAEEQQRQLDFVRQNPAEFTDFNIPWNVNLSYSLSFSRILKPDYSGFKTEVFSNISVNGDFSLSPKWKIGAQTYYDFNSSKIQTFSMFISREMHCWQMNINITPVGLFRSFNISIYPKSGILRDLRINRSRFFYNQ